jgi:hypothetical protein
MKYLLTAVLLLAACGGRSAPPKTPAETLDQDLPTMLTCWNGGEILYRETTRTLEHHAQPEVLTIYASGAWRAEGQRERRGCLSADELATLDAQLQSVRRAAPDAPMCAEQPTHDTLIEVPGVGALSYRWPCAPGPDATTAAGIALARKLTRARLAG